MERADSRTFFECGACLGDCQRYDADAERARAERAWAETQRYLAAFTAVPRIGPGMPVARTYLDFRAALQALQARHGGRHHD